MNTLKAELIEALFELQSRAGKIVRNRDGFGYKYVDLETLYNRIQPILSELGLFVQSIISDNKIEVTVHHIKSQSSQCIGSYNITALLDKVLDYELKLAERNPNKATNINVFQDMGRGITYLTRYLLCSGLGLFANISKDDDAAKLSSSGYQEVQYSNKARNSTGLNNARQKIRQASGENIIQYKDFLRYYEEAFKGGNYHKLNQQQQESLSAWAANAESWEGLQKETKFKIVESLRNLKGE